MRLSRDCDRSEVFEDVGRHLSLHLLQIQMLQIQVQIDAHSQMAVAWPIHVLKSPTLACLS